MRSTLVMKYALVLVVLSGTAFSSAQASHLAYEISRIGNSCDESQSQTNRSDVGQSGTIAHAGTPAGASDATGDLASKDSTAAQLGSLIQSASGAVASVKSSACDGLMAAAAGDKSGVDADAQIKVLVGTADNFGHQPAAVPLSAAAWLFSSALLGFIVVANRRKV